MPQIVPFVGTCVLIASLSACVTVADIPQSTKSVAFDSPIQGAIGIGRLENYYHWPGIDKATAFEAARYAMDVNGATVISSDPEDGTIIGDHGITWVDSNALSGIYVTSSSEGVRVAIISQSANESLSFAMEPYNERLVNSMYRHLMRVKPGWRPQP